MEEAEFSVTVADLEEGAREYVFPIRSAWAKANLEEGEVKAVDREGELFVTLTKSGRDVVVQGHLKCTLEMPCARCLKAAQVTIDSDITALMVPEGTTRGDEEGELGTDQPDLVPYDGQTVVLDDLVRDEILLEIPMIPLCSEDCPGMSTPSHLLDTEPEPAVDPRLLPLTRMKLPKE